MHKDDLTVWNEIIKKLNRTGLVAIQSPKRKRVMQAVDKLVQAALAAGMEVEGEE
jgi:magnesium-transporting ATPase (P-type)